MHLALLAYEAATEPDLWSRFLELYNDSISSDCIVTLKDTAFFNEYYENFTAGKLLSFTIDTTNILDSGGTPDLLTVAILDSFGNELPTTGPASEFLDVSLAGGAAPEVSTFGSVPGSVFPLAAPIVQIQATPAVPEPTFCWELLSLIVGLSVAAHKSQRSTRGPAAPEI